MTDGDNVIVRELVVNLAKLVYCNYPFITKYLSVFSLLSHKRRVRLNFDTSFHSVTVKPKGHMNKVHLTLR